MNAAWREAASRSTGAEGAGGAGGSVLWAQEVLTVLGVRAREFEAKEAATQHESSE